MDDYFEDLGLVLSDRGTMAWGHRHGALRWAPRWVRKSIITVWNFVACRIVGHFIIDYREIEKAIGEKVKDGRISCTNCCKEFTVAEYERYRQKHPQ
jgi:hypothetical protein